MGTLKDQNNAGRSSDTADERQRLLPSEQHIVIRVDEPSGAQDHDNSEERRCRICFEATDNSSPPGNLISPCLCKGSSRYIHLGCLQTWREMSPKKESFYRCDTCHYHYSFTRPWIAHVLESPWFLHVFTVITFFALWIGIAYGGHALDESDIWKWKKYFQGYGTPPLTTFMGLDWKDVTFGVLAVGVLGIHFLIGIGCICCINDQRGRSGAGLDVDGGCSTSLFLLTESFGDCGGCGDCGESGEAVLITLLVSLLMFLILVGTFGTFIAVFMTIQWVVKWVLGSMKEVILEVK